MLGGSGGILIPKIENAVMITPALPKNYISILFCRKSFESICSHSHIVFSGAEAMYIRSDVQDMSFLEQR